MEKEFKDLIEQLGKLEDKLNDLSWEVQDVIKEVEYLEGRIYQLETGDDKYD